MSGFVFKFEYYTRFIFRKFDQSEYIRQSYPMGRVGWSLHSGVKPIIKK